MNIQDYIIEENISVLETMEKIDSGARGIAFVCRDRELIAVVTDGDIRRYILQGGDLQRPVWEIAHHNPISLLSTRERQAEDVMRREYITAVPIVNSKNEILDIKFWREEIQDKEDGRRALNIPLVIMAGGKGMRLRPYTDILPKPLIPIGDRAITEHIMDRFAKYNCTHIIMIVKYKKDFIKAYFTDNETKRDIVFIEEQEYLGTGGGLKLLSGQIKDTFFMSNCDILINADYAEILDYHRKSGNIITMVCARKDFEIPYGTVCLDSDNQIIEMKEKPHFDYYVNTGLYVIEPSFLEYIPQNIFVHITDVIEKCVKNGEKAGSYLIRDDDWMDMGQLDELEKMKDKMGIL